MKNLLLLISVLYSSLILAQTNQSLADELAKMVIPDQQAAGLPPKGLSFTSPEWIRFKDSVYSSHYVRLKAIFANTGYAGFDQVGLRGSKNFWLLVQHLDKWPEFQQEVLKSMEVEVGKKNASSVDFAFLTDRVRLNTAQKQVYGTQVEYNTDSCQAMPKPLEDPQTVNRRRKSVGLEPIEAYLNQMSESHFMMNKDSYEKRGIKGPKLYQVYKGQRQKNH